MLTFSWRRLFKAVFRFAGAIAAWKLISLAEQLDRTAIGTVLIMSIGMLFGAAILDAFKTRRELRGGGTAFVLQVLTVILGWLAPVLVLIVLRPSWLPFAYSLMALSLLLGAVLRFGAIEPPPREGSFRYYREPDSNRFARPNRIQ